MADRQPPHNLQAEESLLGAMLLSGDAIDAGIAACTADDFYKPAHGHVFSAIKLLHLRGEKAEPITVAEELHRADMLNAVGGTAALVSLQAGTPSTTNARRYAGIVVEHATLRRMIGVAGEIAEIGYDLPIDVNAAIARVRELVDTIELPSALSKDSDDLHTFLDASEEYDWLVHGLIERHDRVLLVAPEGYGKSTLLRQVGVQISQGIHPFAGYAIPPLVVLLVDLENPPVLLRRKLRPLAFVAHKKSTAYDHERFHVIARPGGIDVTSRGDARWLLEQVQHVRPDVVIIGPIYKMHADDPRDEKPAARVARVLDTIRERYGCALLMETHAPHASDGKRRVYRPYGASLWLRWPEFGLSFVPDDDDPTVAHIDHWRGPRDERDWPDRLRRGGEWPWTAPNVGDYTDASLFEQPEQPKP